MNRLVKNYLAYLFYDVIALVVPLFTAPYLARILHADNYGIYSYVYSVTSLICTISLIGLNSYGSRQVAYDRDNEDLLNETFWELFIMRLVCGVVGTIVFIVCAQSSGYSIFFYLFYAYFLANVLDFSWIFVGLERMLPCVLKNTASKLVMFVGVFILVKTENDVGKYLLLVAVSTLVANLAIIPLARKYISRPKVNLKKIPKHLLQSFALCAPTIVTQIYLQIDKVMLKGMSSSIGEVSFYDQAEKIILIPLSVITSLSAVMMPRIANEFAKDAKADSIEKNLTLAGKYSVLMAFPMMCGMIGISSSFIPWYLGNEYLPSASAMIVLSPILVLNSLTGISGSQYLVATNQTKVLLVSSIVASTLNIICNAFLIPRFGCIGAAVATVSANFVNLLIQYSVMCKQINMKNVFQAGYKYFLDSLIMLLLIIFTTKSLKLQPTVSTTILQIVLGGTAYILILALRKDDILLIGCSIIKSYFQKKKKRI